MDRLRCTLQPYAWGSRTAIAALCGRAPSQAPEAELWMGAHPLAPSRVVRGDEEIALDEAIARAPEDELGPEVARAFGPRLPFLLKVLAAAEPLSLQAHPSAEQARAGFAGEQARGVPLASPSRNYKDASAKPELLCALEPFEALCGFRDPRETRAIFEALALPPLAPTIARLGAGDLRGAFEHLMTLPKAEAAVLAGAVADACKRAPTDGRFARACAWAARLGEKYPGDVGAVTSLFLHHVELAPGDALYLDAGILHAYLRGTGVEIMASSDNVLRGGLTPKHVDVPELLRVLSFEPRPLSVLRPAPAGAGEIAWETPAAEFRLSRLDLAGAAVVPERRGPELLFCASGRVDLAANGDLVELAPGDAAFVRGSERAYAVSGTGSVYRATVGRV